MNNSTFDTNQSVPVIKPHASRSEIETFNIHNPIPTRTKKEIGKEQKKNKAEAPLSCACREKTTSQIAQTQNGDVMPARIKTNGIREVLLNAELDLISDFGDW